MEQSSALSRLCSITFGTAGREQVNEGEAALAKAVQGLKAQGKTVVLLSHRPGVVGLQKQGEAAELPVSSVQLS